MVAAVGAICYAICYIAFGTLWQKWSRKFKVQWCSVSSFLLSSHLIPCTEVYCPLLLTVTVLVYFLSSVLPSSPIFLTLLSSSFVLFSLFCHEQLNYLLKFSPYCPLNFLHTFTYPEIFSPVLYFALPSCPLLSTLLKSSPFSSSHVLHCYHLSCPLNSCQFLVIPCPLLYPSNLLYYPLHSPTLLLSHL